MNKSLDLDWVRTQFQGLRHDYTFLDNAGGSQILKSVVNRIQDYYQTSYVQLGASYAVSQLATERVNQGRAFLATYLNASAPEEVMLGSSTSSLFRILAHSFGQIWQAGDEVIVSNIDHESNISPWMELEKQGINIKYWEIRKDSLEFSLKDLQQLLSPKTKLVAVTHCSNVLGTINPIADISKMVHENGSLLSVDGVAYAPHRLLDVQAWEVDFYGFSAYKVYAGHQGVLYGKKDLLEHLPNFNHYFIQDSPWKFEPGGVNSELTYGFLGLEDYFRNLAQQHHISSENLREILEQSFERIAKQEEILSQKLLNFLHQKSHVRVIGLETADKNQRVPTISFVVEGKTSDEIVQEVDQHNIGIRFGDFYAKRLIEALDLQKYNGVVRVSMVHYNTVEEVENLIKVLDKIF